MLKCSHCKKVKSEDKFSINKANTFRGQRSYLCLICERKHRELYLRKNPHIREKMNTRKRKIYATEEFQIKQRERYYKKRYCITSEFYEKMLNEQSGICAICGRKKPAKGQKYFHVDHNHKTGKVRGLLCVQCNTIIGNSKEQIGTLEKAIKYLKRHLDET